MFAPPFPESRVPSPYALLLYGPINQSINQLFVFFNFFVGYYYFPFKYYLYDCPVLQDSLPLALVAGLFWGCVHCTPPFLADLDYHILTPNLLNFLNGLTISILEQSIINFKYIKI
jgi:hypothetical protein